VVETPKEEAKIFAVLTKAPDVKSRIIGNVKRETVNEKDNPESNRLFQEKIAPSKIDSKNSSRSADEEEMIKVIMESEKCSREEAEKSVGRYYRGLKFKNFWSTY